MDHFKKTTPIIINDGWQHIAFYDDRNREEYSNTGVKCDRRVKRGTIYICAVDDLNIEDTGPISDNREIITSYGKR